MDEKQKRLYDAVQEIEDAFASCPTERREVIARALCEQDFNDFDLNSESLRRRYRDEAESLENALTDITTIPED
jgi:hypothetical protein